MGHPDPTWDGGGDCRQLTAQPLPRADRPPRVGLLPLPRPLLDHSEAVTVQSFPWRHGDPTVAATHPSFPLCPSPQGGAETPPAADQTSARPLRRTPGQGDTHVLRVRGSRRNRNARAGSGDRSVDKTQHPSDRRPVETNGSVLLATKKPPARQPWRPAQPVGRRATPSSADVQIHLGERQRTLRRRLEAADGQQECWCERGGQAEPPLTTGGGTGCSPQAKLLSRSSGFPHTAPAHGRTRQPGARSCRRPNTR